MFAATNHLRLDFFLQILTDATRENDLNNYHKQKVSLVFPVQFKKINISNETATFFYFVFTLFIVISL